MTRISIDRGDRQSGCTHGFAHARATNGFRWAVYLIPFSSVRKDDVPRCAPNVREGAPDDPDPRKVRRREAGLLGNDDRGKMWSAAAGHTTCAAPSRTLQPDPAMRIVAMSTIVLLCACASSPEPSPEPSSADVALELEVEPEEVAAGDSITLELDNESSESVSYNLCSSGLEREAGGAWEDVQSNRVCTRELRILPPGEEARYTLQLPDELSPGTYRVYTGVHLNDTDRSTQLRSESFLVLP